MIYCELQPTYQPDVIFAGNNPKALGFLKWLLTLHNGSKNHEKTQAFRKAAEKHDQAGRGQS